MAHFELHHYASSRRRDSERLKRAQAMGAHRIDENLHEIDVLRRDKYTCQMCGYAIILNERPRHPKGPSIDHIEWLASGGSHTEDNVRAAHLACNTSEGYVFKRSREKRVARSRAARQRYRAQQDWKGREVVLMVLGSIALIILIVLVVGWLEAL